MSKDLKIATILPYKENYTFSKAQAAAIWVCDFYKYSKFKNQIIIHVNEGSDGTLDFVKRNYFEYTYSEKNIGMPKALNTASELAKFDYILISHDDFYYCPEWDKLLMNEVRFSIVAETSS